MTRELIGYALLAVQVAAMFGGFRANPLWLRWVCVVVMFAATATQMLRDHNAVLAWVTTALFVVGVSVAVVWQRRAAPRK